MNGTILILFQAYGHYSMVQHPAYGQPAAGQQMLPPPPPPHHPQQIVGLPQVPPQPSAGSGVYPPHAQGVAGGGGTGGGSATTLPPTAAYFPVSPYNSAQTAQVCSTCWDIFVHNLKSDFHPWRKGQKPFKAVVFRCYHWFYNHKDKNGKKSQERSLVNWPFLCKPVKIKYLEKNFAHTNNANKVKDFASIKAQPGCTPVSN